MRYSEDWLEDMYQEKVREWKKSGDNLSRDWFETEYKEDIWFEFNRRQADEA